MEEHGVQFPACLINDWTDPEDGAIYRAEVNKVQLYAGSSVYGWCHLTKFTVSMRTAPGRRFPRWFKRLAMLIGVNVQDKAAATMKTWRQVWTVDSGVLSVRIVDGGHPSREYRLQIATEAINKLRIALPPQLLASAFGPIEIEYTKHANAATAVLDPY